MTLLVFRRVLYFFFFCYPCGCFAQEARDWWNLLHYDIVIRPDYDKRSIAGSNDIRFEVINSGQEMQIDLQEPMAITAVKWRGVALPFRRTGSAWYAHFPRRLPKGARETVEVQFAGSPRIAVHPPYDNGWIWTTDRKGRPWISVTCEGSGASIWLPCKDVLRDEPDSGAAMAITVPDSLVAVGNGRLKARTKNRDGTTTWRWAVVNPINNYDIIPYIGKEYWSRSVKTVRSIPSHDTDSGAGIFHPGYGVEIPMGQLYQGIQHACKGEPGRSTAVVALSHRRMATIAPGKVDRKQPDGRQELLCRKPVGWIMTRWAAWRQQPTPS